MIGKRGGPGGSIADRVEFRRNLTMVKIKKHGSIKQKGNNRFSETICIFVFSVDRNCTKLSIYIILLVSTVGSLTNENGIKYIYEFYNAYEVGNILFL